MDLRFSEIIFEEQITVANDEHEDEVDEQLPQGDLHVQLLILVVL